MWVKHGIQWIQWWKKPISGSGEGIRGPQWPKEAPKNLPKPKGLRGPPKVDGGIINHCLL